MSRAKFFFEYYLSDDLFYSYDLEFILLCSGGVFKIVRSIKDFFMIVGVFDQRKEVFNGANLVICVQWFSRFYEYGGRSSYEFRKSRAVTVIFISRRVVYQDLSQLLNSGIAGLTFFSKSLKELSYY